MIDGNILDMAEVLSEWSRTYRIKTITETTLDFERVFTVVGRDQTMVVQVAEKSKLNPATIDWALEYLTLHSVDVLLIDEIIEFNGRDYIITEKSPWTGYGYYECMAVETNKATVVET